MPRPLPYLPIVSSGLRTAGRDRLPSGQTRGAAGTRFATPDITELTGTRTDTLPRPFEHACGSRKHRPRHVIDPHTSCGFDDPDANRGHRSKETSRTRNATIARTPNRRARRRIRATVARHLAPLGATCSLLESPAGSRSSPSFGATSQEGDSNRNQTCSLTTLAPRD
jgi:hypothetical protein